jgi:RalA-binding protein 1
LVAAAPARPVFGVPLHEAVAVARIREGFELPAVIYRCVEYLEGKSAQMEEGIYRLSGSSNVIKALKEKFNMGTSHFITNRFFCFS